MAVFSFLKFARSQWSMLPPVQHVDISEHTVVVTGSNTGLGLEAVKHFARMKPKHLVLACRNQAKAEKAIAKVKAETGFLAELLILDMAEFASVSAFATAFEQKYDRLDILACNAGVSMGSYSLSADGWEPTLQVNYISTALVSLLLLPMMARTAQMHNSSPRLVFVSSFIHLVAQIDAEVRAAPSMLEKITSREYTEAMMGKRYELTKLLDVMYMRSLNAHLRSPSLPVVVAAVDPGYCYSDILRHLPLWAKVIFNLADLLFARKTVEGAKSLVWAATAGQDNAALRESLKGAYISDCEIAEPSDFLFGIEGQESETRLWREMVEILSKVDSRVEGIIAEYLSA